jgi:hypothetical protein
MKYGRLLYLRSNIEQAKPIDLLHFGRLEEYEPQLNNLFNNFTCYLNPEQMLWGQFVLSEMAFKRQDELGLLCTLLRPKGEETYDNEDPDNEDVNKLAIEECHAGDISEYISKYIEVRQKILLEKYNGVIYTKEEKEEEEEEDMIDFRDESEGLWDKFNEQWFFYQMTRALAQDDFRKMDEIYNTPMTKIFPELSYLAQRNQIERQQERMQEARQAAMMRR